MKKIFILFTVVLFSIGLASCGSQKEPTPEVTPTPTVVKTSKSYTTNPANESRLSEQLKNLQALGDLFDVLNYYRGDGVTLAVIDSGFDYEHPEFYDENGNSIVSELSVSIKYNGSITTEVGRTKVGITDYDSHGTMCASLACGTITGEGIVGIAPNATLMLIKIDRKVQSMAYAFKYAADNGAKVICTSLGSYPGSDGDLYWNGVTDAKTVMQEEITYAYNKGCVIVAASGNSKTSKVSYPAGYDYVIGAGGMQKGSQYFIWDEGYEGSNYNNKTLYVDSFAPSQGIIAAGYDYSSNKHTYWTNGKGTSFSSPVIAGAACLYFQKYPNATNLDFESALASTSLNIDALNDKNCGYGSINIGALLNIIEDKALS